MYRAVVSIIVFLFVLLTGRGRRGGGCLNFLLLNSLPHRRSSGWPSSSWGSGPFGGSSRGNGGGFGGFGGGGDFDGGGAGGKW